MFVKLSEFPELQLKKLTVLVIFDIIRFVLYMNPLLIVVVKLFIIVIRHIGEFSMCYRPIRIYNRSRHFDPLSMPCEFYVPCGHCESCRNQMRNEWFARSWFHWRYTVNHGGESYFYTLTFDSAHLPMFDGKPCFSKSIVQKFVKRLKQRLLSKYGVHLDVLITSEYGELFSRPHHHAAFYLDRKLFPCLFYKQVQEAWNYGFVYSGKNGGVITNSSGLLYVTKYITKDCEFDVRSIFLRVAIKHYRAFLHCLSPIYDFDLPVSLKAFVSNKLEYLQYPEIRQRFNEFMREFRSFIPFNVHSNRLGVSALDSPSYLNENKGLLLIPRGKQFDTIPLPRYLRRALWYDRHPNEIDGKKTLYRLNDRGKRHKLLNFESDVLNYEKQLIEFQKTFTISKFQFDGLRSQLPDFESHSDLITYIRHCDIDFHNVALYKYLLRGRFADYHVQKPFKEPYKLYFRYITAPEDKRLFPLDFFNQYKRSFLSDLWNNHTDYMMYEEFLRLYETIVHYQSECYFKEQLEKRKIARKIRENIKLSNLKISNYAEKKDFWQDDGFAVHRTDEVLHLR